MPWRAVTAPSPAAAGRAKVRTSRNASAKRWALPPLHGGNCGGDRITGWGRGVGRIGKKSLELWSPAEIGRRIREAAMLTSGISRRHALQATAALPAAAALAGGALAQGAPARPEFNPR